eukprot:Skav215655  [mRNA]  locus=scaffold5624:5319:5852:- [translate_table: standard]
MKKEEALEHLKTKTLQKITKPVAFTAEEQIPEDINKFIENIRATVNSLKVLKANGNDIIKGCLQSLTLDDLKRLFGILETKKGGHRDGSNEKLVKAMVLLFPKLTVVVDAKSKLKEFENELIADFVGLYLAEYNDFKDGTATFCHSRLLKDIEKEIGRRDDGSVVGAQIERANCTVS